MKVSCQKCRIQTLLGENGDIIKKILIKLKELRKNKMKKLLRWLRETEVNQLMEITIKIENIQTINMEKEISEEELARKMILMEISSIWEKDFQKIGDFLYILFDFNNYINFWLLII
jgi:hypothetical protein